MSPKDRITTPVVEPPCFECRGGNAEDMGEDDVVTIRPCAPPPVSALLHTPFDSRCVRCVGWWWCHRKLILDVPGAYRVRVERAG